MNVLIIGFGAVGSMVGALLNASLTNAHFYILEPSSSSKGRILDFCHACACENNEVTLNDSESIQKSDFIIYCAGYSNEKGTSRETVSSQNKQLLLELFQKQTIKKTTSIIAVTNPVEKITKWIQALFPNNLVVGTGTSLDTYRLNYLIAQRTKKPISAVNTLVVGEHGQMMTPIFSKSTINNETLDKIFTPEELDQLLEELKNSATLIRETEKATKYGVAACVQKITLALLGKTILETALSIQLDLHYKKMFDLDDELIVASVPIKIENKKLKIVALQDLTKNEYVQFKAAILHLK
jgi:L-lactate dehydrogenase